MKKNIVLISCDSLRPDFLGCYGNRSIRTPHSQWLADNGVIFENAISQYPSTIPNHASMLTGLYPFNHGIRKQYVKTKFLPGALKAFERFKSERYEIASFVGQRIFGPEYGYPWDFQHNSGLTSIKRYIATHKKSQFFMFIHFWITHSPYKSQLPVENPIDIIANLFTYLASIKSNPFLRHDYMRSSNVNIDEVLNKSINRVINKIQLHKMEKIRRFTLIEDQKTKAFIREGYRRSVEMADFFVGQVIKYLEDARLLDKVILVLTSDHGESFNEYNIAQEVKGRYGADKLDYEHGHSLTDNVLKVPLIFFSPNSLPQNKKISHQVRSIDIMPTIFDILGLYKKDWPLKECDGVSMLDLVNDPDSDFPQYSYSETFVKDEHKVCIRDNSYKLIIDYRSDKRYLYNLSLNETDNIIKDYPEIADSLRKELMALLKLEQKSDSRQALTDEEFKKISKSLKDLGYF